MNIRGLSNIRKEIGPVLHDYFHTSSSENYLPETKNSLPPPAELARVAVAVSGVDRDLPVCLGCFGMADGVFWVFCLSRFWHGIFRRWYGAELIVRNHTYLTLSILLEFFVP